MRLLRRLHPQAVLYATAYAWAASVSRAAMGYDTVGLRTEIGELHAVSRRLFLIEDTPYWMDGNNPVACLLRPHVRLGTCMLALRTVSAQLNSTVDAVAKTAGMQVIPTLQWFCTSTKCPSVIAGTIVYRDTEHVSTRYAKHLDVPLAADLSRVLG